MSERPGVNVLTALFEQLDARLLLSTTDLCAGPCWPESIIDIAEVGRPNRPSDAKKKDNTKNTPRTDNTAQPDTLGLGFITGDFNGDTKVNDKDIDLLSIEMRAVSGDPTTGNPWYDLDKDGDVDLADHDFLVINIIGTGLGDTNIDWSVDVADLNLTKAHRFTSGHVNESNGWSQGDFDGDGNVDMDDMNLWKGNKFTSFVPNPDPIPAPDSGNYLPGEAVTWQLETAENGSRLVVLGTDGADAITVSRSGLATVIISAGGTYNLTDNITSVQIYGFGGDDLLVSISGAGETIYGGSGFDSFWVDSLDTIADVETAETAWNVHRVTGFYQPTSDPSQYVSLEISGQDIVDPVAGYGYADYSAKPLFVDGPELSDIIQGAVGDCYYLAALGSVAMSDPAIIEQMIAPLGDGSYAVRFFRNGQANYVRIDSDLPTYSGTRLAYAQQTPDGEIWVALLEKAYAQFRYGQNSYSSLNGGWMTGPYAEITNLATISTSTSLSDSAMADFLIGNLQDGHAISAGSYSGAGEVIGSHAYVIESVQNIESRWYVTVYNVWGYDGKATSGDTNASDGLVTLSMDQLNANFFQVVVSLA